MDSKIIKLTTEFGKIIAVFTPYKWHSVPHMTFVSNAAGGTYILSLDRWEKFIIPTPAN